MLVLRGGYLSVSGSSRTEKPTPLQLLQSDHLNGGPQKGHFKFQTTWEDAEVRVFWEWPIWLEPVLQKSPAFLRKMDPDRRETIQQTGGTVGVAFVKHVQNDGFCFRFAGPLKGGPSNK